MATLTEQGRDDAWTRAEVAVHELTTTGEGPAIVERLELHETTLGPLSWAASDPASIMYLVRHAEFRSRAYIALIVTPSGETMLAGPCQYGAYRLLRQKFGNDTSSRLQAIIGMRGDELLGIIDELPPPTEQPPAEPSGPVTTASIPGQPQPEPTRAP